MFHAINVGDAHYDKLNHHLGDKGNIVITNELRKPLAYAKAQGIPHVVFLGDVADKARLSYAAHELFISLLWEFDGVLDMWVILGNHDFDEESCHSLQLIKKMHDIGMFTTVHIITTPEQHMIDGVCVNFLPYPAVDPLPPPKGYKGGTVNYAHFEVPGAIRDNGMKIKGDVKDSDSDDEVYVIGHLHTPHSVGNKHFVGTLYQTNFGESLPKSFTESKFRIKNGELKSKLIRHANDPEFKLFNITVESLDDLKKCQSKNPLHFFKLFIKEDVIIPDDWLLNNPQVLYQNSFKTQRDLKELVKDTLLLDNELDDDTDVDDRVSKYLTETGATEHEVARAIEILNRITGVNHG